METTTVINFDKWRRAMSGKSMGRYIFYTTDPFGNKHRYIVNIMYNETKTGDEIYLSERLLGKWEGSAMGHELSNMQNKPYNLFDRHETTYWESEAIFNNIITAFSKKSKDAEKEFNSIAKEWFEVDFVTMIKDWLKTGTETYHKHEFILAE